MKFDSIWRDVPSSAVLFVVLATLWGGSFVAIEAGVSRWPPLLFAAVRYDLAGAVILVAAVFRGSQWRPTTRDDFGAIGVVAVFVVFAHHALLYVGQQTVPGPVASAVVALAPVITAVVAPLLVSDEGLSTTGYVGVALGFVGVIAVTDPGGTGGVDVAGTSLVFGATMAFAVGTLLLRRTSPAIAPTGMQGWGMLAGAALLHVGSQALGEPQVVPTSPTALVSLWFLVLGPGVVAFHVYFRLLDDIGATRTTLVGYVEPAAAAALAFVLFGYVPTDAAFVGFSLVVVSFALVEGDVLRGAADDAVSRLRTALQ